MATDLDSPAITGTAVIGRRAAALADLLHRMRVVLHGARGRRLEDSTATALTKGIDAVALEVEALRVETSQQLRLGAEALEAAHGVLKAIGAERRVKPREPQPARFEGCYVPEPERPEYLKDMAKPTNVVILATVRQSRPEGGAR